MHETTRCAFMGHGRVHGQSSQLFNSVSIENHAVPAAGTSRTGGESLVVILSVRGLCGADATCTDGYAAEKRQEATAYLEYTDCEPD